MGKLSRRDLVRRVAPVLVALAPAVTAGQEPTPAGASQGSGFYVAGLLSTTVAYRPHGGDFKGWQKDLSINLGLGRFVTSTIAIELDLGPTLVEGDYGSFALTPGLIWAFHKNVYAAARFIVPLDPELNFAVYPGLGLTHTLQGGLAPFVEMNLLSNLGRGDPDLGFTVTLGATYAF